MTLRAAGDAASGRESLDLLTRSAAILDSPDTRLELARSLLSLATAQSRHGMTAAARRSFAAAMTEAEWCAAPGLAQQAHAGAVATGARPRARAMTGLGALTAGERRVADRVAAGQSNRDIAATLHLTLRTVETHLSAVYRKLGITGRTQLNEALAAET
jgi:DNA-binding CsgD family transcriptional regulator